MVNKLQNILSFRTISQWTTQAYQSNSRLWDVSDAYFDVQKDDSYTERGAREGGSIGQDLAYVCGTAVVQQLSRSLVQSFYTDWSGENAEFVKVLALDGSVAEWLACWTQAQKGPGSNRSRDVVG